MGVVCRTCTSKKLLQKRGRPGGTEEGGGGGKKPKTDHSTVKKKTFGTERVVNAVAICRGRAHKTTRRLLEKKRDKAQEAAHATRTKCLAKHGGLSAVLPTGSWTNNIQSLYGSQGRRGACRAQVTLAKGSLHME